MLTYAHAVKQAVTDESNIGVVLWIVLIVVINALWIGIDVWLKRHGHEYLTTEFREGLRNPLIGPILAFVTFGSIAAFLFHMFTGKPN